MSINLLDRRENGVGKAGNHVNASQISVCEVKMGRSNYLVGAVWIEL
jgi:hypothetical protein